MKRFPENHNGTKTLVLLVFSSLDRQNFFSVVLRRLGVEFLSVQCCRQARELLRTCSSFATIVTDASLEDANWCDVLRALVDNESTASVVVVAPRTADERLWSEVIWRGVHDMLVEPFTHDEVRRVLEGALRASDVGYVALAPAS